ncbi:MAG: peptidase M28 family protein, partial [Bacteroidota bacterium]
MKRLVLLFLCLTSQIEAQTTDERQLKAIYDTALTNGKAYDWLNYLSNQIGGRLTGSVEAQQAVEYTKIQLDSLGLDRVWLQPVMVPKWVRGTPEFAYFETKPGLTTNVPICALGGSVATPDGGVKANILEVNGIEQLKKLGKEKVAGKIIFYNRPMDPTQIDTFNAYSGCVDQRYLGAAEAGKYGAVGVIVRSMNLRLDDFPHAGSMSYGDTPVKDRIPAAAISTKGAELLSTTLALNPEIKFY